MKIAIVGGGIIGRLVALCMTQHDHKVTLVDRGDRFGASSASFVAAGMLAPFCELDVSEPLISTLGLASLALWPNILALLPGRVMFSKKGSLVLAHPQDLPELAQFSKKIDYKTGNVDCYQKVNQAEIKKLEPGLDHKFSQGLFFPEEGQIDNKALLPLLADYLETLGTKLEFKTEVTSIKPYQLEYQGNSHIFDLVIDCRGTSAQLSSLRSVRGEVIMIASHEIELHRPIRLLHPRYPIYIVPRPEGKFVIGSTMIESDSRQEITIRSALELLSAAFSINAAFGQAHIIDQRAGLRPAFPNHLPQIIHQPGLIRINGLYRHGFLVSPALAKLLAEFIESGYIEDLYSSLFGNDDETIH